MVNDESVRIFEALFGADATVVRDSNFRLLLGAGVLGALGTSLISPILDSLIDPLGTNSANIGLMISAFTAPAIVLIPVSGTVADRYGRNPVLVAGLLLFGTAGRAIAFAEEFQVVLALRCLQGIGYTGIIPIIITSIGDAYDSDEEAAAQGIRIATSGLSQVIFPIVVGIVIVAGWQYPFLIYAIAIPVALLTLVWFDEPTKRSNVGPNAESDASNVRELLRLLTR